MREILKLIEIFNIPRLLFNVLVTLAAMFTIVHITKASNYSVPPNVVFFGGILLIVMIKIWSKGD